MARWMTEEFERWLEERSQRAPKPPFDRHEVVKALMGAAEVLRQQSAQEKHFERMDLFASVLEGAPHPDAPHSVSAWRRRSRKIFHDARRDRLVDHMPWHHREIWLWAASCQAGEEWIETEVVWWERFVLVQARKRERAARSNEFVVEDEYVYEDGDEYLYQEGF